MRDKERKCVRPARQDQEMWQATQMSTLQAVRRSCAARQRKHLQQLPILLCFEALLLGAQCHVAKLRL